MKCTSCGFINDDNNKFCSNCGSELSSGKGKSTGSKSKYRLGENMHKKNIHNFNSKTPNLKPLWITVGIVIGSILIAISFDLIFHKYPNGKEFPVESKSSNPVIEAQVTAIASKFICSCQTKECAETSLEACKCDVATEERQFIRGNLVPKASLREKNLKPDDIVVALANKYGFLKSEFASKYKVNQSKVWNSN